MLFWFALAQRLLAGLAADLLDLPGRPDIEKVQAFRAGQRAVSASS
jgi:hypothetical protein